MYPPIKQAITTAATYVAVTLPTNHSCSSFSLWTENGSAWYYATDSAGSDAVLVTSDGTNSFPLSLNIIRGKGETVCYAKATVNTNLVGLITKE